MRIERLEPGDDEKVSELDDLFDQPARADATTRFLGEPGHHLLVAYVDDAPVGMVTGVEMTHPDKGTEMFLYELSVAESFRRRGIGRALTQQLAALARLRGCSGMWVLTDTDNTAAIATYGSADARSDGVHHMLTWTFDSQR
ncbi:MAG: GNAT family N-acetyltransferase [Acidimicrobiia bacterium]